MPNVYNKDPDYWREKYAPKKHSKTYLKRKYKPKKHSKLYYQNIYIYGGKSPKEQREERRKQKPEPQEDVFGKFLLCILAAMLIIAMIEQGIF